MCRATDFGVAKNVRFENKKAVVLDLKFVLEKKVKMKKKISPRAGHERIGVLSCVFASGDTGWLYGGFAALQGPN